MSPGWIVRRGRKETSPLPVEKLVRLAKAGKVRPDDLVRREDQSEWQAAWTMKGLFDVGVPVHEWVKDEPASPASEPAVPRCEDVASPSQSAAPLVMPMGDTAKACRGKHAGWIALSGWAGRNRLIIAACLLAGAMLFVGLPMFVNPSRKGVEQEPTAGQASRPQPPSVRSTHSEPSAVAVSSDVPGRPSLLPEAQTLLNGLSRIQFAVEAQVGFVEYGQLMKSLASERSRLHEALKQRTPEASDTQILDRIDLACRLYEDAYTAWKREMEWKQVGSRGGNYAKVRPDMAQAELSWAFAASVLANLRHSMNGERGPLACGICGGTANLTCPLCHGSGECFDKDSCRGMGLATCFACNGTGVDEPATRPDRPVAPKPCMLCGGTGKTVCPGCAGTGKCPLCKGRKQLTCRACAT